MSDVCIGMEDMNFYVLLDKDGECEELYIVLCYFKEDKCELEE